MKINAAAYIRVSTDDQTEYSPEAQLKALQDYAQRNNMIISNEHIYKDEGISGKTAKKRPAFMKMITTAKKYKDSKDKPFEVILVHKFDRFSRNREESVVYKSMLRKECGIKVISITEHIEDDKFSVILEAMLEAMAEYYSLNLADEVKKGMTEKAYRGEFQSTAPFGYKWENGVLLTDEKEAEYVKYIFNAFINGTHKRQIAIYLNNAGIKTHRGNQFQLRTVDYILKNIIYIGYTRWNKNQKTNYRLLVENNSIITKGTHSAIISEEVFNQAQEILKRTAKTKVKRASATERYKHWLSGLIKCSECGGSLGVSGNNLQCINYSHSTCKVSHYIPINKMEQIVLNELSSILTTNNLNNYIVYKDCKTDVSSEQILLKKNIEKINTRLIRLKEAYLNEIINLEEYKKSRLEETVELEKISKQLNSLNNKKFNPIKYLDEVRNVYEILTSDTHNNQEKGAALKTIVEKIVYDKKNNFFEFHYLY